MVEVVCKPVLQRGAYYYSTEKNPRKIFSLLWSVNNFQQCDLLWYYVDFYHVKMCVLVELHW